MLSQIALNLAYVALLTAAFTRTLSRLRVILVLGALCFITFAAFEGIYAMIGWNLAIGGLHAHRLIEDRRRTHSVVLTEAERALRDDLMPATSYFDFHVLWSMGLEKTYEHMTVIDAGAHPGTVSLILAGRVEVRGSDTERVLGPGALVGEMSFVTGSVASAEVVAAELVTVRQWSQRGLTALAQTHPPSAKALDRLIARDLVAKAQVPGGLANRSTHNDLSSSRIDRNGLCESV